MDKIRAAAVQFEHAAGDKEKNLGTVDRFLAEAAQQGCELVVFPEFRVNGYWFLRKLSRKVLLDLAEPEM
jgi:predicted amidohydrolase